MNDDEQNYAQRERLWDEGWPINPGEQSGHSIEEPDADDEVMPFPETVGTTDVIESIRDAEPYMPPIDPPVLPGGNDGISVATGFGTDAAEEATHDRLPIGDEDIQDQAVRALLQDSLVSHYNLRVQVNQGVVRIVGRVPSIDDGDHAMTVVSNLPGVIEVLDETTLDPTITA